MQGVTVFFYGEVIIMIMTTTIIITIMKGSVVLQVRVDFPGVLIKPRGYVQLV